MYYCNPPKLDDHLNKDTKEFGEFDITVNLGGKKGKIILAVEKK